MVPRRLTYDVLEDRRLLAVTTNPAIEPAFRDLVSVSVVGEHLFYNDSSFNGNIPGIGVSDDGAIAPDKTPLLPGGTASFANYSSYSRGINGVMIDIAGLPTSELQASDFTFLVGNNSNPSSWTVAPAPSGITVRLGAGASGSDRVEIVWPNNVIENEWLQVTVNATTDTGLTQPDVFYFGNAIGETGNSATDAIVNFADAQGVQNHLSPGASTAPITDPYDLNRDGQVDATDEAIATANTTTAATALQLISVPVQTPSTETLAPDVSLFNFGDGGFPVIEIPVLVTTNDGTVLAFAEARSNGLDESAYAIVERRSTDGGVTWSPPTAVVSTPPGTLSILGQEAPIVDTRTGEIFMLYNTGTVDPISSLPLMSNVLVTSSSDDGLTWSTPVDITTSTKVTAAGNPGPPGAYTNQPWGWYALTTDQGIQLTTGPDAGRLLVTADHRFTSGTSGTSWANVIYSDDDGQTWHLGGGTTGNADGSPSPNDNTNESTLVQLSNGNIYMSSRIGSTSVHDRGESISTDGGITWSVEQLVPALNSYQVDGSLLRLDANTILFSSPASLDSNDNVRHQMTIWYSVDDAQTWSSKVIDFDYAGYSSMTLVGPDTILIAYDRGDNGGSIVGGTAARRIRPLGLSSCASTCWGLKARPPTNLTGTSTSNLPANWPISTRRPSRITALGINKRWPTRRRRRRRPNT